MMFLNPGSGYYNGSISPNGAGVNYNTTSDIRLKENIRPTGYHLADLLKIQVRDYNYKTNKNAPQTGFIAQQLYSIYPMAVTKGDDKDVKKKAYMVDYGKLTPLLVQGIQEQEVAIEALKKANATLQTALNSKASDISALRASLQALSAEVRAMKASAK